MYVDAQTQVSVAQAFTATAVSTNSIDMTAVDPDIAEGNPIGFGINVDVAADFTSANETYVFDIIDDDDAALGSAVILASMAVLATQLTLGRRLKMPVPPGRMLQRYLGLQMTLGGTTPTITISAHLAPMNMLEESYRAYPKGYVIS